MTWREPRARRGVSLRAAPGAQVDGFWSVRYFDWGFPPKCKNAGALEQWMQPATAWISIQRCCCAVELLCGQADRQAACPHFGAGAGAAARAEIKRFRQGASGAKVPEGPQPRRGARRFWPAAGGAKNLGKTHDFFGGSLSDNPRPMRRSRIQSRSRYRPETGKINEEIL